MATLGNSTATQLSVLRSLISSGTLSVSGASTFAGKTMHNGGIGTTTLAASNKATFTGGVHINTSTDAYPLVIARGGSETEALKISVNDSIATFRYENDEKSNQFKFLLVNTDTENGTNQPNESVATISGGASGSIITATSFSGALSGNATSATKLATKRTLWGQDFDGTSNVSGAMSSVGNISSTGSITATAFYESSDERLKDFEDDITVDIDKLKSIRKAYFRWKDNPDRLQLGVSAQSVKAVYPEIVSEDEDGMLTVAYDKLSVIALAAVDELNDTVRQLKTENQRIMDKLNVIENLIKSLNICDEKQ